VSGAALPRLLAGTRAHRAVRLEEHLAIHGPLRPAAREALPDACERAGLRGRGGALFSTAVKLREVAGGRGRRTVVVNGAEGEPMSAKDRVLLAHAPHLVLDGALAAADAVGAREVLVALPASAASARVAVVQALAERRDARRVTVATVPDAFLSGEETALIAALEGRPPRPALTPPRPSERGLRGRPTLVQNAETLAHLALIARHGPEWFRALGTAAHPGSTLVTLGGCARGAGVHEIALGTRLADLLDATGGTTEPVRALLIGGYHGAWLDADAVAGLTLDGDALAVRGASLGAGVIVALPRSACPVTEVACVMGWLAEQTAGQCGPCVHGLAAIAGELDHLAAGRARPDSLRLLARWSGQVAGRGACHHPDGSVRFLRTALGVFEPELELHRRFGGCEGCDGPPVLATPEPQAAAA
jgi:NADH:ubiquinone oxidoreductase subunit F (NADH-binding)